MLAACEVGRSGKLVASQFSGHTTSGDQDVECKAHFDDADDDNCSDVIFIVMVILMVMVTVTVRQIAGETKWAGGQLKSVV